MEPLLIHSLAEFEEPVFEVMDRARPKSIVEVGSESGRFTDRLVEYCRANGARLTTVEPFPSDIVRARAASDEDLFELFEGISVDYYAQADSPGDLVILDGDHNYHTVACEIAAVESLRVRHGGSPIVLLHDVGFPCGRRDFYYAPARIPPEALHPHSFEHGVTLDETRLVDGGFRGEGSFACALTDGGARNGVLTAIDDFVASTPGWTYHSIPAVFGLGALARTGSAEERIVARAFTPYDNRLVRRLERNRLALYLRVIALQDELARRGA